MSSFPFNPYYGRTTSVASSAGNGTLAVPADARCVLLTNVGTQLVFFKVRPQGSVANANNTDVPLPANTSRVIQKDSAPGSGSATAEVSISIFGTAAGSTIYATPGSLPAI